MIATNETDESAAEVPFFLPTTSNPNTGLAGYSFALGDVQIKLPGGAWINATLPKIREVGFGQYAVRLMSSQTLTAGTVYVRATVTGAQPYFGSEVISDQGGDITVLGDGVFPFYLPQVADPVYGSPITGHTFTLGEVQIALPNAGFVNANITKIAEVGFGAYAYQLLNADGATGRKGKAYLFANVSGAQKFLGFITILGLSTAAAVVPTPSVPSTVINPASVASSAGNVSFEDHVSIAVSRLPQQFKFPLGG